MIAGNFAIRHADNPAGLGCNFMIMGYQNKCGSLTFIQASEQFDQFVAVY